MEGRRKYELDSEMENTFLFEMIIPPDGSTNRPLLHFRQFSFNLIILKINRVGMLVCASVYPHRDTSNQCLDCKQQFGWSTEERRC